MKTDLNNAVTLSLISQSSNSKWASAPLIVIIRYASERIQLIFDLCNAYALNDLLIWAASDFETPAPAVQKLEAFPFKDIIRHYWQSSLEKSTQGCQLIPVSSSFYAPTRVSQGWFYALEHRQSARQVVCRHKRHEHLKWWTVDILVRAKILHI